MTISKDSSPASRADARTDAERGIPPIALVLLAAALWSTGGLFIKATDLTAFQLSFGRSLLATLTVAYFTRHEGFRVNGVTLFASVLYAALLLLFVIATKLTTAANAIFLQYTAPVYILIFEPLFYKEKLRARDLATIIFCVVGMSLFFKGRLEANEVRGNLTALASGLCFAFFALLLRHPRSFKVNRASSVIYGNLFIALITAPAFFSEVGAELSLKDAAIVVYLGIIQIGLAYTFFTLGIARGVRSLDAGIVGYIEPVLNPVWVFLFIGERPSGWAVLGGAIIIIAVVFHALRAVRRR